MMKEEKKKTNLNANVNKNKKQKQKRDQEDYEKWLSINGELMGENKRRKSMHKEQQLKQQ